MNNQDSITVNGITYDADEVYTRRLLVKGVQPTDFEEYKFIEILTDHKNKKANSGGVAPAGYRYDDLADLSKFNEHQYPYYIDVVMTTTADKKGDSNDIILSADFANAKEMILVPRTSPVSTKSTNVTK